MDLTATDKVDVWRVLLGNLCVAAWSSDRSHESNGNVTVIAHRPVTIVLALPELWKTSGLREVV